MRKPESDSAVRATLEGLHRLEARVDALAEVVVGGFGDSPRANPENPRAKEAARRRRDVLLLARPGQRAG
jgi:hypothetical protein